MGLEVVGVLKSRPFLPSSVHLLTATPVGLNQKASWQVPDELVASFQGIQQDPYVCRFPSSRSNHSMFKDMGLPVRWSDNKMPTLRIMSGIDLEFLALDLGERERRLRNAEQNKI